jgi:hypothetical protein
LVTLPPSGTGVTESLALDHAPFTRITPAGTFVADGETLVEKSPPFLGTACGLESWLQVSNGSAAASAIMESRNRKGMLLLGKLRAQNHARQDNSVEK